MNQLSQIRTIIEDWASDDSDEIDDLDALCQIADLLGVEVEARTENP